MTTTTFSGNALVADAVASCRRDHKNGRSFEPELWNGTSLQLLVAAYKWFAENAPDDPARLYTRTAIEAYVEYVRNTTGTIPGPGGAMMSLIHPEPLAASLSLVQAPVKS